VQCLRAVAAGQHTSARRFQGICSAARAAPQKTVPTMMGCTACRPPNAAWLALLGEYRTSKEIAAQLGISARTVENHRAHICEKLVLRGTHALVKFALQHKAELG